MTTMLRRDQDVIWHERICTLYIKSDPMYVNKIWNSILPIGSLDVPCRNNQPSSSLWPYRHQSRNRGTCLRHSRSKSDSTPPVTGEIHDDLTTMPGEAKLKICENSMIFCSTSSGIRPLSCGIAKGKCSCGKVSHLEHIINKETNQAELLDYPWHPAPWNSVSSLVMKKR